MSWVEAFQRRLSFADASSPRDAEELRARVSVLPPCDCAVDWSARSLLVALFRHLDRQQWVGEVARGLSADLDKIGRFGWFGHPRERSGAATGWAGWRYDFHGAGCCLTHDDGTTLDVDFVEGSTEWIDPWFYERFLDSAPRLALIEKRLVTEAPVEGAWEADLDLLVAAGLLEGTHKRRLTTRGREVASLLSVVMHRIELSTTPLEQAWLALVADDSVLAEVVLPGDGFVHALATDCRRRRAEMLGTRLEVTPSGPIVQALAVLGRHNAEAALLAFLSGGVAGPPLVHALKCVTAWGDVEHAVRLLAVAERAPTLADAATRVTAIHGTMVLAGGSASPVVRARLEACLANPGGPLEARAAFLLTLLNFDRGLRRIRDALESTIPWVRQESAALCLVLGTHEALMVLEQSSAREARELIDWQRGLGGDDSLVRELERELGPLLRHWLAH